MEKTTAERKKYTAPLVDIYDNATEADFFIRAIARGELKPVLNLFEILACSSLTVAELRVAWRVVNDLNETLTLNGENDVIVDGLNLTTAVIKSVLSDLNNTTKGAKYVAER